MPDAKRLQKRDVQFIEGSFRQVQKSKLECAVQKEMEF